MGASTQARCSHSPGQGIGTGARQRSRARQFGGNAGIRELLHARVRVAFDFIARADLNDAAILQQCDTISDADLNLRARAFDRISNTANISCRISFV